jgi:hypothetical protein
MPWKLRLCREPVELELVRNEVGGLWSSRQLFAIPQAQPSSPTTNTLPQLSPSPTTILSTTPHNRDHGRHRDGD